MPVKEKPCRFQKLQVHKNRVKRRELDLLAPLTAKASVVMEIIPNGSRIRCILQLDAPARILNSVEYLYLLNPQ